MTTPDPTASSSDLRAGVPAGDRAADHAADRAAQDPGSREEVDVGDREAVARWCRALGVTDEALLNAVRHVGPRVDRIKDYLGAGGMAGSQSGG